MKLLQRFGRAFSRKPRYLAVAEYWVYTSDPSPANVAGAVAKLTRSGAITPAEAALASDVRFFASQIARQHNPQLFRPDLFSDPIEPTAEQLEALARADTIIKLRYLSEEPLPDLRHAAFLPRLAVDVARIKKAGLILDNVSETLHTPDSLEASLPDGEQRYGPAGQIRTCWIRTAAGGKAVTRGLLKAGIPELETPETRPDLRNLALEVLALAAEKLWRGEANPNLVHVSCYDDHFVVRVKPTRNGPSEARILRMQQR